jgi:hypothetical protein
MEARRNKKGMQAIAVTVMETARWAWQHLFWTEKNSHPNFQVELALL